MAVIKQYVNIAPTDTVAKDIEAVRRGRSLTVQAKLKKKKPGVVVYWKLEPDSGNHTFNPKTDAKNGGFSPGVFTRKGVTDDNGVCEVTFKLSTYGGDKFTITAGLDEACTDKALEETYEVWKMMWYQISHIKKYRSTKFAIAEKAYKKHFVELKQSVKVLMKNPPNKKGAIGNFNYKEYKKKYQGNRKPYEAHIILVKQQYDRYTKTDSYTGASANGIVTCALDSNEGLWNLDKTDWFAGGFWIVMGSNGLIKGGGAIDKKQVKKKSTKKISFNIKKSTGKLAAGDQVLVSVSYLYFSGPWAGDGGSAPHNLIAMAGNSNKFVNDTVVHEIGHGIGMVDSAVSTHYKKNGDHCHEGATKSGKSWYSGTCVMYEGGVNDGKSYFCAKCEPYVQIAALSKTTLWKP